MLFFFPQGVLDEILNLIESVSEVFLPTFDTRVDVNCGWKEGQTDRLTDGKPDAYIAPCLKQVRQ